MVSHRRHYSVFFNHSSWGSAMYDKLDNLLQKWVDDTRREMYLNALDVMQRIGFTSAWDEISLMIESENDLPLAMMLDDIYTILTVGLETVLSNHAITIDGDP